MESLDISRLRELPGLGNVPENSAGTAFCFVQFKMSKLQLHFHLYITCFWPSANAAASMLELETARPFSGGKQPVVIENLG